MSLFALITVMVVLLTLLAFILIGVPVYISLGFAGLLGFIITGGISNLAAIPAAMYGQVDNVVLFAIPLYIIMGEVLASGGLAGQLYDCMSKWLYRVPGGLAIASVFACAMFGAVCGVSIAGVAAIGPLAVPEMLKRGYDRKLAAGSVASAGALATLIPPSIVFIVYGSLSLTSISKLFIGGIIPGIILAILMALYIFGRVMMNRKLAPTVASEVTWGEKFRSLFNIVPLLILTITIFVCLYAGVATATELGAIGAVGAIILTRIWNRSFGMKDLYGVFVRSARGTIGIMIIMASAMTFGTFLNVLRVPDSFVKFSLSLPYDPLVVVLFFMLLIIILGCLIDGISIIVISTPILLPAIIAMGFDPLWYGIILAINLEMAVITPPVGLNLYMMKSVVPELKLEEIIAGAFPFVFVDLVCMLIFIFLPKITLWLPNFVK